MSVSLMWTRASLPKSRSKFSPNHFVPLFPKQVSEENLVDLDSNDDVIDDGHSETSNGIISSETQESSSTYSECSSAKSAKATHKTSKVTFQTSQSDELEETDEKNISGISSFSENSDGEDVEAFKVRKVQIRKTQNLVKTDVDLPKGLPRVSRLNRRSDTIRYDHHDRYIFHSTITIVALIVIVGTGLNTLI